jgi:Ca2+/Na+ antiporter
MEKKRGIALGTILIVLTFLAGLVIYGIIPLPFDINFASIYSNVSVYAANFLNLLSQYLINIMEKLPWEIDMSLLVFILQWIVLFLVVLVIVIKIVKHRKKVNEVASSKEIIPKKSKSETDLDILYNMLKKNKSLSIKAISKIFKISREKALDWSKILENHDLVTIEYPTFDIPEVKINEKEKKEPTQKPAETISKGESSKLRGKKKKSGKK